MVARYPNLKEEVGGSIPGCEISSLLDKKMARWSTASCALGLACQPSVLKSKEEKEENEEERVRPTISFCNGMYALCLFVAMFFPITFELHIFLFLFLIKRKVDYKKMQLTYDNGPLNSKALIFSRFPKFCIQIKSLKYYNDILLK